MKSGPGPGAPEKDEFGMSRIVATSMIAALALWAAAGAAVADVEAGKRAY